MSLVSALKAKPRIASRLPGTVPTEVGLYTLLTRLDLSDNEVGGLSADLCMFQLKFKSSSFGNSNSILQLEFNGFGFAFIEIDTGIGLIFSESFSR